MPRPLPAPQELLSLLAAASPRLAALTADVEPARLHTRPTPDEWSATEVLAHMRSCADVWGNCIRRILAEDHPIIRATNPTTWIKQTDYPTQDFHASLNAFTRQRAELLAVLEGLTPEGWSRAATVTGAGKPLERTVHSYAEWLAIHERPHLKQIARVVKLLTPGD